MNIIEAEDMVKGLPDQVLFQEAQFPSGRIPQYLAVSEVQRRQDMRQRFQAQQAGQQQPTVKDQILQGGIGATGMAPPISTAPPMAPAAPPMPQGAPVGMADGGTVPAGTGRFFGGFGPEILNTPDRLQRMYGSVNPGVDNYAARGYGLNLSDVKEFIKNPDAEKYSDAIASTIAQTAQAQAALNRGLRAPPGGVYGGGTGGDLPYGGPTSYSGQNYLRDLISQFDDNKRGVVSVEEIPQGMAVGGIVPPAINQAVNSLSSAGNQTSQSSQPSTGPSRETVIRKVKALIAQGREMDALVLLRQAGINPSEVNMANGGMTPGGIVYMQEGRTVPGVFSLQNQLPGLYTESGELKPAVAAVRDFLAPRRAQFSVIREAEALRSQGRLDEAFALLRSEGIDPSRVLGERPAAPPAAPAAPAAAPAAAPGPVDFMAAQRSQPPMNFNMPPPAPVAAPQAAPQAAPPAPPSNVSPGGIGDLAPRQPRTGGMSVPGMASELFKPQQISEQEQALINLINQQREQGVPAPLNLEPYRQAALQRQQEARDEARRMAIANTLMGLGTGFVAGDPAAGLQRATQMATETLREGRKEAQAEGRSAEALQLQAAQQARQAQIEKMQFDRESLGTVANIYKDLNKSNKESRERALQIFATYDASLQSNISRMQEQGALDRRSILSAITAAEDRIEDTLEAQVGMTAEDKDKIRATMRERAIRQIGSLFPNLDVEGMIGGGKGGNQPSGPREKPLSAFGR